MGTSGSKQNAAVQVGDRRSDSSSVAPTKPRPAAVNGKSVRAAQLSDQHRENVEVPRREPRPIAAQNGGHRVGWQQREEVGADETAATRQDRTVSARRRENVEFTQPRRLDWKVADIQHRPDTGCYRENVEHEEVLTQPPPVRLSAGRREDVGEARVKARFPGAWNGIRGRGERLGAGAGRVEGEGGVNAADPRPIGVQNGDAISRGDRAFNAAQNGCHRVGRQQREEVGAAVTDETAATRQYRTVSAGHRENVEFNQPRRLDWKDADIQHRPDTGCYRENVEHEEAPLRLSAGRSEDVGEALVQARFPGAWNGIRGRDERLGAGAGRVEGEGGVKAADPHAISRGDRAFCAKCSNVDRDEPNHPMEGTNVISLYLGPATCSSVSRYCSDTFRGVSEEPAVMLRQDDGWLMGQEALLKFHEMKAMKRDNIHLYEAALHLIPKQYIHFYVPTAIALNSGAKVPLIEVFRRYIEQLAFRTKTVMQRRTDILWVLVVPSGTTVQSRQFIREAARLAGLVPSADSANLKIVSDIVAVNASVSLPEGQYRYLVHFGVGSARVCTVEGLMREGSVRSFNYGYSIQSQFAAFLKSLLRRVSPESELNRSRASEWQQLLLQFTGTSTSPKRLSLLGVLTSAEFPLFKQALNELNSSDSRLKGAVCHFDSQTGTLEIPDVLVNSFVRHVVASLVNSIVDQLLEAQSQKPPIQSVLLAGEFPSMKYLQKRLAFAISRAGLVIVPTVVRPAVAVGGVIYGISNCHRLQHSVGRVSPACIVGVRNRFSDRKRSRSPFGHRVNGQQNQVRNPCEDLDPVPVDCAKVGGRVERMDRLNERLNRMVAKAKLRLNANDSPVIDLGIPSPLPALRAPTPLARVNMPIQPLICDPIDLSVEIQRDNEPIDRGDMLDDELSVGSCLSSSESVVRGPMDECTDEEQEQREQTSEPVPVVPEVDWDGEDVHVRGPQTSAGENSPIGHIIEDHWERLETPIQVATQVVWDHAFQLFVQALYLEDAAAEAKLEELASCRGMAAMSYLMVLLSTEAESGFRNDGEKGRRAVLLSRTLYPELQDGKRLGCATNDTIKMHVYFVRGRCCECKGDRHGAFNVYREAAEMGHPEAQIAMGQLCKVGLRGVSFYPSRSVRWFRTAAAQDYVGGERQLGIAYLAGFGVHRDTSQARIWLLKAMNKGDVYAAQKLS